MLDLKLLASLFPFLAPGCGGYVSLLQLESVLFLFQPEEVVNLNISELGSCCPQLEGMGICLDLLGSAWIYLDLLGSSWIYLDLDLLGSTWIYLDLPGGMGTCLDLLGSLWVLRS